jgi:hypothetical protein
VVKILQLRKEIAKEERGRTEGGVHKWGRGRRRRDPLCFWKWTEQVKMELHETKK